MSACYPCTVHSSVWCQLKDRSWSGWRLTWHDALPRYHVWHSFMYVEWCLCGVCDLSRADGTIHMWQEWTDHRCRLFISSSLWTLHHYSVWPYVCVCRMLIVSSELSHLELMDHLIFLGSIWRAILIINHVEFVMVYATLGVFLVALRKSCQARLLFEHMRRAQLTLTSQTHLTQGQYILRISLVFWTFLVRN